MSKRSVHWEEGGFVTPHHFQASERYLQDRLRETEDWLIPNCYGVSSIRFDQSALMTGVLKILECKIRLKEGTTIEIPEESQIIEISVDEIRKVMGQDRRVRVWIGVPHLKEGQKNIYDSDNRDARYEMRMLAAIDENTGEKEDIAFRFLRPSLQPDGSSKGLELLPVCQLKLSDKYEGQFEIEPSYVPPLLDLNSWGWLKESVKWIHDRIEASIETESQSLAGVNLTFESSIEGRGIRILRLNHLSSGWTTLQSMLNGRMVHPQNIYTELCRLLGQLSIFGETRKPPKLRSYDHDDIGPIFQSVLSEIRKLLEGIGLPEYERHPFVFLQKDGKLKRPYRVSLDPKWEASTYSLYLGLETTGVPHNEVDEIIRKTNYKMGETSRVSELFRLGLPGLVVKPLDRIPRELGGIKNTTLFSIERSGSEWIEVQRTHDLGFWFENRSLKLGEGRKLVLEHPQTKKDVPLEFALYVTHDRGGTRS